MRSILLLLVLLASTLVVACRLTVAPEPASPLPTWGWRHTRDGWESSHDWAPRTPEFRPTLHPVTVAGMQLLIVLTALLGPQAAAHATGPPVGVPTGRTPAAKPHVGRRVQGQSASRG